MEGDKGEVGRGGGHHYQLLYVQRQRPQKYTGCPQKRFHFDY